MTLRVIYFDNAPHAASDQAIDITTLRVPGAQLTANAEEGSVAMSSVMFDDDDASLDFIGMRRIIFAETAEDPDSLIILNGYLAEAEIGRGPATGLDNDIHHIDTARRWSLDIADLNSLVQRKVITEASGDRPAETDYARVLWVLGLSYPITNLSGLVSSANTVNLDAADFRNQTAFDVLNQCAQASGKQWFILLDESQSAEPYRGAISLFYDFETSTAYPSDDGSGNLIRLTNVLDDHDNVTTFMVADDAKLRRSPARLYSGVLLIYANGSVYVRSTATANTYFGTSGGQYTGRDVVINAPHVKTAAAATAQATRHLNDLNGPDDRITCRYLVPATKVNKLREGQRCQFKFTHMPDYGTSYTAGRVLTRTVTQLSDDQYDVEVTISPTSLGGGGGSPTFPAQAALYAPTNKDSVGGGGGSVAEPLIHFAGTGDGPDLPGGHAEIPLTGSLSYIQSPSWPGAGTNKYTGILVGANGTLDIRFKCNFTMVVNTSHPTMTFRVLVDGATAGSFSIQETSCTGLCGWGYEADFTAANIAVSAGDIITAEMELSGPLGFTVPGGTGNPSYGLFVSGDLE